LQISITKAAGLEIPNHRTVQQKNRLSKAKRRNAKNLKEAKQEPRNKVHPKRRLINNNLAVLKGSKILLNVRLSLSGLRTLKV